MNKVILNKETLFDYYSKGYSMKEKEMMTY